MKKYLALLFVMIAGTVYPQGITDLTMLRGHSKKTFTSGSGKEYIVKWKDSLDRFPVDPHPLHYHVGQSSHTSDNPCPSVEPGGDNRAFNNRDFFDGNARCDAKTSFSSASATVIELNDLSQMFKDFINEDTFEQISSSDGRTEPEDKNFTINDVRIYAIKREQDEDFHIIIGPASAVNQGKLINVEITGLPTASEPGFSALQDVRNKFTSELTGIENIAGSKWSKYLVFPKGIPVNVTGSLFYDVDHKGAHVGPAGIQSPTCMELHPVTSIDFIAP